MTDPTFDDPPSAFGATRRLGTAAAGKQVVEDISDLVKAEISLAMAEVMKGLQPKLIGIGMFAAAGVLVALGSLGLLITAGLALALIMPGWAAAATLSGTFILIAVVLVLIGRAKLPQGGVSTDVVKANVQEDIAWTKVRLSRR